MEYVTQYKYLGVPFSSSTKFSVLTSLGLNVVDILVKNQKTDYVLYVMLLKMNFTYVSCHKYASQRKTLYDSLEDSNILLCLDSSKTFFELMTSDNKTVMKAIGKYIKECSIT